MTDSLLAACGLLSLAVLYLVRRLRRAEAHADMRALQLEDARRQEALGTLAGGIAHDFNNILGSIMGFGALLDEDLIAYPEQRALARQVNIAAERGQAIVAQLMRYSRKGLEDDRSLHMPRALDAIVRESMGLVRPSIRSSSRMTYDNRAKDDDIMGDAGQVGQAIVNLCINADHAIGVKAGEIAITLDNIDIRKAEGGAGTAISGAPPQLRAVRGRLAPGRYARIGVRDNGDGMTREVLARVFDPFFTTKGVNKGTGLGLAAIDGIMQGHGGAVIVETARFRGTTFFLLFPLDPPPRTGEPSPAAPKAGKASR